VGDEDQNFVPTYSHKVSWEKERSQVGKELHIRAILFCCLGNASLAMTISLSDQTVELQGVNNEDLSLWE